MHIVIWDLKFGIYPKNGLIEEKFYMIILPV